METANKNVIVFIYNLFDECDMLLMFNDDGNYINEFVTTLGVVL